MKDEIAGQGPIVAIDSISTLVESYRSHGKRIVLTNGCFDLVHIGHVRFLQEAKRFGDILIVGINSDSSVRAIKGSKRPIIPENERAELIGSIKCVDLVVIFNEESPIELVKKIMPDTHVKGMEYSPGNGRSMPEATVVLGFGGTLKFVDLVNEVSTTRIIDRVRSMFDNTSA